MLDLKKIFGAAVLGTAIVTAAAVHDCHAVAMPAADYSAVKTDAPEQAVFSTQNAVIVNLDENAYDLSPAVRHIVTKVKDALAADQKIIVMLGEEHNTIAQVRLIELVRRGLQDAGIQKPVIATEAPNNLLEEKLHSFFPGTNQKNFRDNAERTLANLKQIDHRRYHRLQALASAGTTWNDAPLTNLENTNSWLHDGLDIRLIDIASEKGRLNTGQPEAAAFIAANAPATANPADIKVLSADGIRLRNLWMATTLRGMIAEKDTRVILLQTGVMHIGGYLQGKLDYINSLHRLLTDAANDEKFKVVSVFQETNNTSFEVDLSSLAHLAMDTPDTVIIQPGMDTRHTVKYEGSFEDEAETLVNIADISNMPQTMPVLKNVYDTKMMRLKFLDTLEKELETLTPAAIPAPPPSLNY